MSKARFDGLRRGANYALLHVICSFYSERRDSQAPARQPSLKWWYRPWSRRRGGGPKLSTDCAKRGSSPRSIIIVQASSSTLRRLTIGRPRFVWGMGVECMAWLLRPDLRSSGVPAFNEQIFHDILDIASHATSTIYHLLVRTR